MQLPVVVGINKIERMNSTPAEKRLLPEKVLRILKSADSFTLPLKRGPFFELYMLGLLVF